jgi:SET domain-containing protein
MPPLDGIKVIRSPIHGYGVQALRPFQPGEIIVHGDGITYHEDEDFDDTYALLMYSGAEGPEQGPELLLDLTDQTRWINHSCDPNTEVETLWDAETRTARAWWTALRPIAAGEELTYDYAFAAHLAEPCSCRSPRCRGVIVDESEIHLVSGELRHLLRRARKRA